MREDTYEKFESLKTKSNTLYFDLKSKSEMYASQNNALQELILKLHEGTKRVSHLDDTLIVFKTFQDKVTQTTINYVEELVNKALEAVFNDEERTYFIKIETTQARNNNTAQFLLHKIEAGEEVITNIVNNGFGIQSLIGLVIQVYFILQHKQAPILFLDESLTAISTDKLPKLKQFIQEVSKRYNFHFVLIAHMESLFELADYTYYVENGEVFLKEVNNE